MEDVLQITYSPTRDFVRYDSRKDALNSAFELVELCVTGEPDPLKYAEWSHLTWFPGMDPRDGLEEDPKRVAYPAEVGFMGDINAL